MNGSNLLEATQRLVGAQRKCELDDVSGQLEEEKNAAGNVN